MTKDIEPFETINIQMHGEVSTRNINRAWTEQRRAARSTWWVPYTEDFEWVTLRLEPRDDSMTYGGGRWHFRYDLGLDLREATLSFFFPGIGSADYDFVPVYSTLTKGRIKPAVVVSFWMKIALMDYVRNDLEQVTLSAGLYSENNATGHVYPVDIRFAGKKIIKALR